MPQASPNTTAPMMTAALSAMLGPSAGTNAGRASPYAQAREKSCAMCF